jgi:hypothetical protein
MLRAFMETIPVVEVGAARLELATSPAGIRAFLDAVLDADPLPHAGPPPDAVASPRDVARRPAGAGG